MKFSKLTALLAAVSIAAMMTSCANDHYTPEGGEITTADVTIAETVTGTEEAADVINEDDVQEEAPEDNVSVLNVIEDREGNEIEIPASINTIVSAAPSVTEILTGLGLGSKIIAADVYSADVEGIDPAICTLDFYNLNIEELAALEPDLVIINGISMTGADDPYASLKDAGANVVYIPTSSSISSVKLDIEFLAAYTGTQDKGAELIADIDAAVADVSAKAAEITEKKSVYFEIGAAPYLYSCGSGTFIDEILDLIGAENIYGDEEGWLSNSEESVIAANPDVILTNVTYDGYDFNEIKTRAGWEGISAVVNGNVYYVDANDTSRASQNIVNGIYDIAEAVYPEIYK